MVALRDYQLEAVEAVRNEFASGRRSTLLAMATGCHEPSQLILMADGTTKAAADISIGERLMGSDGTARTVLALHGGIDEMYKVTPTKGEPFIVNSEHLLQVVRTQRGPRGNIFPPSYHGGATLAVKAKDWNSQTKTFKHMHKLYRSEAIDHFEGNDGSKTTIDPYFIGVLLGDGQTSYGTINIATMDAELHRELKDLGLVDCRAGEKHVPLYYKTLPIEQRLEVLAGLLDTDGSLTTGGYDFISKSRRLSNDLAFIARSCGLAAYVKKSTKRCGDFTGTYWRASISGDCSIIPMKVKHKRPMPRKQKKNVLRTGFTVEPVGTGEYRGFTVDGNNLYLLDDFTVTHNCGKTTVFGEIARRTVEKGNNVLVLAHRDELIRQAAGRLSAMCGLPVGIEKAEERYDYSQPVCVASVQTLQGRRLDALRRGHFSLVIVDEAHHAVSDSYRRIIDHVGGHLLGVTATADRADKRGLAEVFESIAYEYPLAKAVSDGWLCPIRAKCLPLELDLRDAKVSHGDYQADSLGDVLAPYLHDIAAVMAEECKGKRTVVFLPLIATADVMADELRAAGMKAASVWGADPDRTAKIAAFEAGELDVLCNAMLLTEGWDCPEVDCIVVLRPTKSRPLYTQMVGRGTRLAPGKGHLLLLDFLWMTEKHDLCRPASLLGKEPEVTRRMVENAEDGEEADLFDAAEDAESEVREEREAALAKELEAMRRRKKKLVDPLQFASSIQSLDLMDYRPTFAWEQQPATKPQAQALERAGIDPAGISAGQAHLVIDALVKRREAGLATPKQIRCLERFGFRHVGSWPFDAASNMISRIAARNWKGAPPSVDPATYDPRGGKR